MRENLEGRGKIITISSAYVAGLSFSPLISNNDQLVSFTTIAE